MSNAPIREAVEHAMAEGDTISDICRRTGWMRPDRPYPDITRLKRRLGLAETTTHSHQTLLTRTIRYDLACQIVEAIGRDPVEFGL